MSNVSTQGFTIWLTGLSGAGKSTIARRLEAALTDRGRHVEVLDGDEVRENLSKGLGFSRGDRDTNIRRIAYVAKLVSRSGGVAITAAISPYRATRNEARAQMAPGAFVEVYVHCPLDELVQRDPKGLYAKALRGEIAHFTGVSRSVWTTISGFSGSSYGSETPVNCRISPRSALAYSPLVSR